MPLEDEMIFKKMFGKPGCKIFIVSEILDICYLMRRSPKYLDKLNEPSAKAV